jgi:spore coat polysaccharide biosynthesis protein SpsF
MGFIQNYFFSPTVDDILQTHIQVYVMSAIAIIQARMSSSRLPGKVLMPLAGKPMLWHIVERARAARNVGEVIVATSIESTDDAIQTFCYEALIPCFRGSLTNVLSRYLEILKLKPYEYFVRVTGDCPLIDPHFIDLQITALQATGGDQIWLSSPTPALCGQGVHSTKSLVRVAAFSSHADDYEHVGSRYFSEHPDQFRIIGLDPPDDLVKAKWRVSVDELEDYVVMKHLYSDLWRGNPIPLKLALEWMTLHPEVMERNSYVVESSINQEISLKNKMFFKYVASFYNSDTQQHAV